MRALILTLGGAAAIGLASAVLGGFGLVGPQSAAAGAAVAAVGVAGATILLSRDIAALATALRDVGRPDRAGAAVRLLTPLHQEVGRLSRRLSAAAATTEQHRRADSMILDHLPDPLVVLAEDRSVLRANTAARETFAEEMPAVLRHPDLRAAIEAARTSDAGQTARIALSAPVQRDILATVLPMKPPLADGGQVVVVLSDRTHERALDRMRQDFVANVSHELRTPLASLIGFTETLLGPAADDPPAQRRFLGIMAQQGARMHRLIDDLLSLSRIEMMEHQPPADRVDLAALLTRLIPSWSQRLNERGTTLVTDSPAGLPPVIGDTDQIIQVLHNLVENAIKYGKDAGTVRIALQAPAPSDAAWPTRPGVVISVADDGIGIPREHLPRLTERFYRVDKGRSRTVGGTGLGLAIVKHITNRHRGQMRIDSEEGVGTTVSVWLPTTPPPDRLGPAAGS